MNKFLQIAIDGLIVYIIIWLFNYFVFVKKNKKLNQDEMPLELIYLAGIYKIDPTKVNFRKFQIAYCFINAFIITTTYLIIVNVLNNFFTKVIFGIATIVLLIILCYGLLGKYYLKQQKETVKEKKKKKSKK